MADALSRQEWRRDEEMTDPQQNVISSRAGGALRSPFGAGGCERPALTEEKKMLREEDNRKK